MFATRLQDGREASRTACKIKAVAHCLGRSSPAAILDLSSKGIRIYLRQDINAAVGSHVTVETEEIGSLSGDVRWIRLPYMGIELGRSSNTMAKINSYFKSRS